jgi:hypothetical protein
MPTSLESRVARLEKTNRRLLIMLTFLTVVTAAVLLLGAARQAPIQIGSKFQLLDETGAVRAELALRNGQPGFYLRDEKGVERVSLFHQADGSGLHVGDAQGVTRIGVVQFAHGGGGVALHGPESRGAAVLYFKNSGSLRLFDADGRVTDAVPASLRPAE